MLYGLGDIDSLGLKAELVRPNGAVSAPAPLPPPGLQYVPVVYRGRFAEVLEAGPPGWVRWLAAVVGIAASARAIYYAGARRC